MKHPEISWTFGDDIVVVLRNLSVISKEASDIWKTEFSHFHEKSCVILGYKFFTYIHVYIFQAMFCCMET